jgi:hypothetical protein
MVTNIKKKKREREREREKRRELKLKATYKTKAQMSKQYCIYPDAR